MSPLRRTFFVFGIYPSIFCWLTPCAGNGCTGTAVGTCSPGRGVYTLKQLHLQSMVSQKTFAQVELECADSLAFTAASGKCQAALLRASDEAGPYNNYNVQVCSQPAQTIQCPALPLHLVDRQQGLVSTFTTRHCGVGHLRSTGPAQDFRGVPLQRRYRRLGVCSRSALRRHLCQEQC